MLILTTNVEFDHIKIQSNNNQWFDNISTMTFKYDERGKNVENGPNLYTLLLWFVRDTTIFCRPGSGLSPTYAETV